MNNTYLDSVPIKLINIAGRARKNYNREAMEQLKTVLGSDGSGLVHPISLLKYPETFSGYDYFLIAGGRRLRAFQELGLTEIPAVITTEDLDGHTIKLRELSENIHREPFTWDEEVRLKAQIHELYILKHGKKTSTSPDAAGHSIADTAALFGETQQNMRSDLNLAKLLDAKPDLATKFENKTQAKRRVKLAAHRIEIEETIQKKQISGKLDDRSKILAKSYIVGDFFKEAKKFENETFHLINHDIDYPIDIRDEGSLHSKFNAEKASGTYRSIDRKDYPDFMRASIKESYRILKKSGWLIIWFGLEYYQFIKETLLENKFKVNHSLGFWHKNIATTRNPDLFFGRSLEPFFYARKGGATIIRPHADMFSYNAVGQNDKIHPFEKPLLLNKDILQTFAITGATVLDAFAGSGNFMLAAANCSMQPIGIDLSQEYKDRFDLKALAKPYGEY